MAVAGANFELVNVANRNAVDDDVLDCDVLNGVGFIPTANEGDGVTGVSRGAGPVNPAKSDAANLTTPGVSAETGAGDAEVDKLVVAVLDANVLKQDVGDEGSIVVVNGEDGALAVNMEDVDVSESDATDLFHGEFVTDLHGVAAIPISEGALPNENVIDVLAGIHKSGGGVIGADKKGFDHYAIVVVV